MKMGHWLVPGILVLSVGLACTSSIAILTGSYKNQAELLKNHCQQLNLQAPDVLKGDSLYNAAQTALGYNNQPEALRKLDLSISYYELALAKRNLEKGQAELALIQTQTQAENVRLETYQKLLSELQEIKK